MVYQKTASMESMLKLFKNPFDPKFVKCRVGATSKDKKKGIALFYIDSREVQKRLDDVCGMAGWSTKMWEANKGVFCSLTIQMPSGDWVTKTDGGEYTKVSEFKGACSDALKRAAVQFGIGRYLYYIPNQWYPLTEYRTFESEPKLPDWALPQTDLTNWEELAIQDYDPSKDIDLNEIGNYEDQEAMEIIKNSKARREELLKELKK